MSRRKLPGHAPSASWHDRDPRLVTCRVVPKRKPASGSSSTRQLVSLSSSGSRFRKGSRLVLHHVLHEKPGTHIRAVPPPVRLLQQQADRKSTRLNSSH